MILLVLLYFNPRAFIKSNVLSESSRTLADVLLLRKARVNVLHRSPLWKLRKKQMLLLGNSDDAASAETAGRNETVDGTATVEELDAGYKITTSDGDKYWSNKIAAGYLCSGVFYSAPYPLKYEGIDPLGVALTVIVGAVVSIAVAVPNFMDFLIYKEVSTEKTKKYKKAAYTALIIGSVILVFISFVAADIILEQLGAPHLTKETRDKCYVISEFKDADEVAGRTELSKARRQLIKKNTRATMRAATKKLMQAGVIANNSRNYILAKAGLLAAVDTPFIQQASMRLVDAEKHLYRFTLPCGAALTRVSASSDAPPITYNWISDVTYTTSYVETTFVEAEDATKYTWCRGNKDGSKAASKEGYQKDSTTKWDFIYESDSWNWFVWVTECGLSRRNGKCFFGYKYSPAGNFVMRRVVRNPAGGYIERCTIPSGSETEVCVNVNGSTDATLSNVSHIDSYAGREDGWFENMSHMITQEGWSGWDPSLFADGGKRVFEGWHSSIIPSVQLGDIQDSLRGRSKMYGSGKKKECKAESNKNANMREANDTCYTEFDMVVSPGSQWVEGGEACTDVYVSQAGEKIQVSVDTEKTGDADKYCSIVLLIGDKERTYYIRPGEPWVGYHLDAWRCVTASDGAHGNNCDSKTSLHEISPELFSAALPTVTTDQVIHVPGDVFSNFISSIKNRVMQVLLIFAVIAAIAGIVALCIFLWTRLHCKHAYSENDSSSRYAHTKDVRSSSYL